jgi:hypothetical protein
MSAKLNTSKKISLSTGSQGHQSSGKTVPGPGSVRGGGQSAKQVSGGGKSAAGAKPMSGLAKRGKC